MTAGGPQSRHPDVASPSTATGDEPASLGLFFSRLRHELRAPLNPIINFSEMLLEDADGGAIEPIVGDVEKILIAGQEMLRIISEVLDPKKTAPRHADIDLDALSNSLHHQLRTPLDAVMGYSEMVLEELGDSTHPERDAAAADVRKIKNAGRQLLGVINYLIEVGRLTSAAQQEPRSTVSTTGIEPIQARRYRTQTPAGRILIVDDSESNREVLQRRLRKEGHEVSAAEGGFEALEMLSQGSFDLVLLDIMMPGLNGYEVLQRVKADDRLRHIPVIMISALDELDNVVRCIEIGADDYLAKPFKTVLLRARVGACLEKKRLHDKEIEYRTQIEAERNRSDALLQVILPRSIITELKNTGRVQPRRHENVAVLFSDIVGFTSYCDGHSPEEVITHLQTLYEAFENIAARHQLEKIKTIGDAFMVVGGLVTPLDTPVLNAVKCGLEMIAAAPKVSDGWKVRVSVHAGPVVAGVVGRRKYAYDVWGDTVNTSSRIESAASAGELWLSGEALRQIAGQCRATSRGPFPVKGKKDMEMFSVEEIYE